MISCMYLNQILVKSMYRIRDISPSISKMSTLDLYKTSNLINSYIYIYIMCLLVCVRVRVLCASYTDIDIYLHLSIVTPTTDINTNFRLEFYEFNLCLGFFVSCFGYCKELLMYQSHWRKIRAYCYGIEKNGDHVKIRKNRRFTNFWQKLHTYMHPYVMVLTVQITFIFIGQTPLVFGKCVCTCATKHSNAFRTFLNWLKNSKRVWHEPKLHISRLPLFANFDL